LSESTAEADVVADLQEAVRLSDQTEDVGSQIAARIQIVTALIPRDLHALLRVADEGIERIGSDHHRSGPDGGTFAWGFLTLVKVVALGWCGRLSEAAVLVEKLAEHARGRPDPYNDIQHHAAACTLALRIGDTTSAVANARRLMAATERVDSILSWALGRMNLGWALAMNDDWNHAAEAFSDVLSSARERGVARFWVLGTLTGLGEVRLRQRDFAAARAIAEDILARTKDIPATLAKGQAYLLLARVALRGDAGWSAECIETWLADAESQARQTGHAMLLPDILECRAELAAAQGEGDRRVVCLREALRLYTSVGADGHAARVTSSFGEA